MLLEADKISKTYQNSSRILLDHVSVQIEKGDFLAVTGASGSGKSTLLAILGGFLRPTEGVVRYKEKSLTDRNEEEIAKLHRTCIGYVPQSNVMLKRYNILENMLVPFEITRAGTDRNVREEAITHLQQLGMEAFIHRYPHELSGGELKRVSVARAMLGGREIIIADEPTTGLDKKTSTILLEYLHDYSKKGKAVIVATHDEQTLEYSNQVLHIVHGITESYHGR